MALSMKPKRLLYLAHRWLGIGGCLLFIAWFVSGIVMMYVPYPGLSDDERLSRLPAITATEGWLAADTAHELTGLGELHELRLSMLADRPVYHFYAATGERRSIYADTGARVDPMGGDPAQRVAAAFWDTEAAETRYLTRVDKDQWVVYRTYDDHRPLHLIGTGDGSGAQAYVSSTTGEVVLGTERTERALSWVGGVLHWLYFRPLREQGRLWAELVIWLSVGGCLLALSGLTIGWLRLRPKRRYKHGAMSPFRGLMKWHHWGGVFFGVITLAWIFSGLVSMHPWGLFERPETGATERTALTGGPLALAGFAVSVPAALEASDHPVREIQWRQFADAPYYELIGSNGQRTLVHGGNGQVREAFTQRELMDRANRMMPDAALADVQWLDDYDAYYYPRRDSRPLPVLRLKWEDPEATWHYIDPGNGQILAKHNTSTRAYRWLFNALHSWDFRFLLNNRPLWDLWLIMLSVGGLLLAGTGLWAGWRRLRQSSGRRVNRGESASQTRMAEGART